MDMKKTMILGGDCRQVELYKILKQKGFVVSIFGFDSIKKDTIGQMDDYLTNADYLFLPIPILFNDDYIKMPFSKERITTKYVMDNIKDSARVIFGTIDDKFDYKAENKNNFIDLLKDERYLLKNARLTAQAAISIAMLKSQKSFSDITVTILGYGRIGKQLVKFLLPNEGKINVCTRKTIMSDNILLGEVDFHRTKDALEVIKKSDIVFNTIPHNLFGKDEIDLINDDIVIYELASYPYGFDIEYAMKKGVDIRVESGLPGRFFSKSAAKTIFESFKMIYMEKSNGD